VWVLPQQGDRERREKENILQHSVLTHSKYGHFDISFYVSPLGLLVIKTLASHFQVSLLLKLSSVTSPPVNLCLPF